jgi:hypothetical protein
VIDVNEEERMTKLIDYLGELDNLQREMNVEDRVNRTCDVIEKELGIQTDVKDAKVSVNVNAKEVLKEIERIKKDTERRTGIKYSS